jgi:general secretion pathway protein G
LIKAVDEWFNASIDWMKTQVTKGKNRAEGEKVLAIANLAYKLIKDIGLTEISGFGISSISTGENLNRTKVVVHHYADKGKGLMWKLMDSQPRPLDDLKLLPANTVVATFSDFKLETLWQWVQQQAQATGIPDVQKRLATVEPMLQQMGISLPQLLAALSGRMGMMVTMDPKQPKPLPIPGAQITIPEPALAILIGVKDSYLFDLLAQKMPFAEKPKKDERMMQIPIPQQLPINIKPTIMEKDGWLIIASNGELINKMLSAKETGNGLTSTDEFKKLAAGMPKKGNNIRYLSPRLSRTIFNMQNAFIKEGRKQGAEVPEKLLKIFQQEWAIYSVLQNTDEGTVMTVSHNRGFEMILIVPVAFTAGIVAAIAIPNILTAVQKGKQKATMGDLKSIGTAVQAYVVDKGKAPQGSSLAEIRSQLEPFYIKQLPLKDAWGNDFFYRSGPTEADFAIASAGKDGVFKGWNQRGFYLVTSINQFANDIIFESGQFTFGPKVR